MKACPYCAEQIQDAAVICRFCNRQLLARAPGAQPPLAATPQPPPASSTKGLVILGVLAALMVFTVIGLFFVPDGIRGRLEKIAAEGRAAQEATKPRLEVVSFTDQFEPGATFVYVVGEVRNTGRVPLRFVRANVIWRDDAGTMLDSDGGYLTVTELEPGRTSPFRVMSRHDRRMSRFSLSFTINGAQIATTRGPKAGGTPEPTSADGGVPVVPLPKAVNEER